MHEESKTFTPFSSERRRYDPVQSTGFSHNRFAAPPESRRKMSMRVVCTQSSAIPTHIFFIARSHSLENWCRCFLFPQTISTRQNFTVWDENSTSCMTYYFHKWHWTSVLTVLRCIVTALWRLLNDPFFTLSLDALQEFSERPVLCTGQATSFGRNCPPPMNKFIGQNSFCDFLKFAEGMLPQQPVFLSWEWVLNRQLTWY